jgi:hypothetical protein
VGLANAGLGVYLAAKVKETLFAAITQLFTAALAVSVGFQWISLDETQSLLLIGLAQAGLSFFVQRPQMNPTAGSPTAAVAA